MNQWLSYQGSNSSTEPGPGARVGPASDRQFFYLVLYFTFTQIATDARSNKHAHVTMGYF
jgi:hypothetical protein